MTDILDPVIEERRQTALFAKQAGRLRKGLLKRQQPNAETPGFHRWDPTVEQCAEILHAVAVAWLEQDVRRELRE